MAWKRDVGSQLETFWTARSSQNSITIILLWPGVRLVASLEGGNCQDSGLISPFSLVLLFVFVFFLHVVAVLSWSRSAISSLYPAHEFLSRELSLLCLCHLPSCSFWIFGLFELLDQRTAHPSLDFKNQLVTRTSEILPCFGCRSLTTTACHLSQTWINSLFVRLGLTSRLPDSPSPPLEQTLYGLIILFLIIAWSAIYSLFYWAEPGPELYGSVQVICA